MAYLKNTLIDLVHELALEVKPEGEFFTLKSGAKSRYYLDCRRLTLNNRGLLVVVDMIWDFLTRGTSLDVEAVGGPCVGADPIVGGLLYKFGPHNSHGETRGFLVRKESKDHGKAGRIIGSVQPGDKCVMVEDVTTTGGSSLDAIEAVHEYGAKVVQAVSIVDRKQGAAELFAQHNIPFHSLLSIDDLNIPQ